eukprot:scaffold37018_cov73-Phaeocystis_antarctica.AAC.2
MDLPESPWSRSQKLRVVLRDDFASAPLSPPRPTDTSTHPTPTDTERPTRETAACAAQHPARRHARRARARARAGDSL